MTILKEAIDFDHMPPEVLARLEALEQIDTARGDGVASVIAFGQYVFGHKAAAHHRQWLTEEEASDRVCIQAPPSSAKTTWITIIKTCWFIAKNPLLTNGIGSASDDAADDMTKAIAETIERNPRFKEVFPHIVAHKERGWSSDGYNIRDERYSLEEWEVKRAGDKNSTLAGGGVGSSRFNGFRCTGRFVMDDCHDRKSKHSDVVCKEVVDFVKDTVESRVEQGKMLVIVQTRWSPKDVVNYCESLVRDNGSKVYSVFKHPAITEGGESYWPQMRPIEKLLDIKLSSGNVDFELIYQGNETAMQGQVLKRDALHWFKAAAVLHTWTHYGGVDFAQKLQELSPRQEARHSRFAYAILAHTESFLVLVDGYVGLISMGEAENTFFSLTDVYRPARVGIETNAQNRQYFNTLVRRKIASGYDWLSLMPINTSKDMGTRMADTEPDFRLGAIQVSDASKYFLTEFLDEWLGFGMDHKRNDTLSAVDLARRAAYHLLPHESSERRERKSAMNPFTAIERAYA